MCLGLFNAVAGSEEIFDKPISISKSLNGGPSGTCCTTNLTFTESLEDFLVGPGVSSEKYQCLRDSLGTGDGSRHPFRPSLLCRLSQPQFPTAGATYTSIDSCQKGVITFQAAVFRNASPHAVRRVRENSPGPRSSLRLSSKNPRLALMFRAL